MMALRHIGKDGSVSSASMTSLTRFPDHCIDSLRQIAMCHADIEMVTFDWVESQPFPFPNFVVNRECRNWDKVLQWAKDHHAPDEVIVRPSDIPYRPKATQAVHTVLPGAIGGTHE